MSPVQAFTDPLFTLAGASATEEDADSGDAFSAIFAGLVSSDAAATTTAAGNADVAASLNVAIENAAPEAQETDGTGISARALGAPVAVPVEVATQLAATTAEAASSAITLDTFEVPEQLSALLEAAAAEADESEAIVPTSTIELSASALVDEFDNELDFVAAKTATAAAGDIAETDADVEFSFSSETNEDAALVAEQPGPALEQPTEVPAVRSLETTEAPPDAPPDANADIETSVVRPVGNAQESTETTDESAAAADPLPAATEVAATDDSNAPDPINQPVVKTATTTAESTASTAPDAAGEPVRMDGRPLTQVAEAVIEQLDSEGGEARIILDPPELGEIVIKLHARGEHVSIEVVAQRPEAIQMLRDGSPSLQALLQERGLDLSTAQFTLSQHGRQGGSQGDEQAAANNNSGFAPLLGFDEPDDAATRNHNRLRAAYNPDGAHLYRV